MTSLPSRLLIWTLGIFKVFGTEIKIFFVLNGGGGQGNLCLFENEEGGHILGCFAHLGFLGWGLLVVFFEDSTLVT